MSNYWEETKQMYQQLFEKPKMSEKLLQKPPFKYIFDIILETSRQLGYCQGLYDDHELDCNYYDSKEKKCIFLQKIIDYTSNILGENIFAKPQDIVSGLRPENTNLMLQAIYRAAISRKIETKNGENQFQNVQQANLQIREKQLREILLEFQHLINSNQFKQIFTDSFFQKQNDDIEQIRVSIQQQKIVDLSYYYEKIEYIRNKQKSINDIINNNF